MRFSAADPFDIPRRYADFVLISNGHSPWANNVTYGRLGGRRVRAFDFRYEVGHGTRRVARHYRVIVVEADQVLPDALMWSGGDDQLAPIGALRNDESLSGQADRENEQLAEVVTQVCKKFSDEGAGVQICGSAMMVFTPAERSKKNYADRLNEVVQAVETLAAFQPRRDEDNPQYKKDLTESIQGGFRAEQDIENIPD
jgi:hypothetical protein